VINKKWKAKYFKDLTQIQTEELNKIWILMKFKNSLKKDLWIQTIILMNSAVNNTL